MNDFDDLPPESAADPDHDRLLELAGLLSIERPVIRAASRGEIRRRLALQLPSARPRRLRLLVAGFACTGVLCLVGGALGLTQSVGTQQRTVSANAGFVSR
jgi:hypothetical protein